jgi:hypothetical protein
MRYWREEGNPVEEPIPASFQIAIENRRKVQYNISWNTGHGEEQNDTHSNL